METDTTHLISEVSENPDNTNARLPAWMKVGAVAAASALAGGLAAVWFYRKTLTHPQSVGPATENSNFRINNRE
jgi:hypothetical protein